jgi:hypothetical protein
MPARTFFRAMPKPMPAPLARPVKPPIVVPAAAPIVPRAGVIQSASEETIKVANNIIPINLFINPPFKVIKGYLRYKTRSCNEEPYNKTIRTKGKILQVV